MVPKPAGPVRRTAVPDPTLIAGRAAVASTLQGTAEIRETVMRTREAIRASRNILAASYALDHRAPRGVLWQPGRSQVR